MKQLTLRTLLVFATMSLVVLFVAPMTQAQSPNPQQNGVGIQGQISAPPPTQAATISSPANGAVFTALPVTVTGFCPNGLLVKIFKNDIFSGADSCQNGSYRVQIDLFSGRNDIVARVFDTLDQAGPDSNLVSVTFNDNAARPDVAARVSLSTNFARRGANPGQELVWPLIISGGTAPYAVSVDWGDGTPPDLYSVPGPGDFNVKHKYDVAGSYRALVKATDKNGTIGYLQLAAVANGEVKQTVAANAADGTGTGTTETRILWQPAAIAIPFIVSTFWLGKKYELRRIKTSLQRGEQPFDY